MIYRNLAIIAHVDHGKTTLVDAMLKQSWIFGKHEHVETCVMDSNDQERERWITIYAKNTWIYYNSNKINIVDTPGHADFWSEVERALMMVDCVLLLVDAFEWPMPQTRFVLKKSLELWLRPIVVINKIDKPAARPDEVVDMVFDLFVKLWATNEQLDFPVVYAIAKQWIAIKNLNDERKDLVPLFETIMKEAAVAPNEIDKPLKMQITNLAYDNFLWRMWIGRIFEWKIRRWQTVTIIWRDWEKRAGKVSKVLISLWLKKQEVEVWEAWDIVRIAWIPDIYVWETICEKNDEEALRPIKIDEPTLKMAFLTNDSPFAGREWKLVTSRNIRDRLLKELEENVWMKVEFWTDNHFIVYWRWELQISVLVESMRREGFELQIWSPEVVYKEENWVKLEPIEEVIVYVPEQNAWTIIEKLWKRRWEMKNMSINNWIATIEFEVPTRWLLWYKNVFIIDTKGEWILASSFSHYWEYKWDISKREVWSMVSWETWVAMAYSLWNLQERGPIFINPQTEIYEGMIIWEHQKWTDLVVNATKNKKLTNMRASWNDENIKLIPPIIMTLEEAIDYIGPNEYVEVTPKSIRLRKKYLDENERKRMRA